MFITCHSCIWNLTIRFEECNERFILVNYCHNQTVEFREMCGQSLIKVGQTWSNLIDSLETIGLGENHTWILIIEIEEYGDILVLVR